MKTKLLTLLLFLATSIGSIFASNTQIDGIWYDFNTPSLTATVTYQGSSYNLSKDKYSGNITIPSSVSYYGNTYKVTTIGYCAFYECTDLTSVTIPNSVTSIGNWAFYSCTSLTSVTIPNSVTSIGEWAFNSCTSLTSIHIPNSVTRIRENTFYYCASLISVEIPYSVTSIGELAFSGCTSLASLTIPNSVTSIGELAFSGCTSLASLTIPNSVTSIGELAFSDCSKLKLYTSSAAVNSNNADTNQIVRVSQEQFIYFSRFSDFAKQYVEKYINEWQKKGEFEKTIDWQQRVTEQTRQEKIKALLSEAQDKYIAFHSKLITINPVLGKYDADNEVFAMTDSKYGTMYIAVPINEALDFKTNWEAKKITPQVQIYDEEIKLSALTISMPNGKQYAYRNTDAVNYNLADMEYNFDPIELDIPKTSAPQPQQGQRNITTTKVKAGKSAVDTDIPQTNAYTPNTFAIIFANEDYKNVASVPFAKNDGAIFQKYCQKTFGIPTSNIHYVENASFNDIRIQLAWLKDVCEAFEGKASVIVYYAGHGIPDEASKSAYLLPVDGDGRYVQSAYKINDFYEKLGAMNAKSITVFMDACFSGSAREDKMLASARGVAIKAKNGEPQGNMVVFSAAQGDETAYPNNDEQHGIFTYYLLKKLKETKGDVTLQDLGNYITTNVRQQSIVKNGKPQTPCVIPSATLGTSWQTWTLK